MGDSLNIEVISRLERLEARMRIVESRPAPEAVALIPQGPASFSDEVERLVREQASELETLKARLKATEIRVLEAAESATQLAVRGSELPAKVDPAMVDEELTGSVETRMEDMRAEIESDLAKLNRRTLTTIERGVDDRITARTLPAEKAIRAQAKAIEELRERVNQIERHLQRLVGTVERLLDRPPAASVPVASEPPTFRTYLDHAVKNDPMPPPPDVDPLFRPRIIKDDEGAQKSTPRRPLSPLR